MHLLLLLWLVLPLLLLLLLLILLLLLLQLVLLIVTGCWCKGPPPCWGSDPMRAEEDTPNRAPASPFKFAAAGAPQFLLLLLHGGGEVVGFLSGLLARRPGGPWGPWPVAASSL